MKEFYSLEVFNEKNQVLTELGFRKLINRPTVHYIDHVNFLTCDLDKIKIPSNTEELSFVLYKKQIIKENEFTCEKVLSCDELVKLGSNLFIYESNNALLVEHDELISSAKMIALKIRNLFNLYMSDKISLNDNELSEKVTFANFTYLGNRKTNKSLILK